MSRHALTILTLTLLTQTHANQTAIVATFALDDATFDTNVTHKLHHMKIDTHTHHVYVGATNYLLHLNDQLTLLEWVRTGPKNDSSLCHATGCNTAEVTLHLMNNVNKMLVIDDASGKLIACGSLMQGACYKHHLTNITRDAEFIPISIAANDESASTYAFIGPKKYNSWGGNVLYVGTTFTNNGEYRYDVPAISSRNLDNLLLAEYSFSKQSQLSIDVKYRDHFLVQYVYGFNVSDHAYFVIVQKQSHLPGQEEQGYVSRLARVCINDANYDSYTEVTLQCIKGNDTELINFNLVQDAKIIMAGDELAKRFGEIDATSHVLVAIFRQAKGMTNEPSSNSALCVYKLPDIESKFNENIHMCFNGSIKYRNMGYVSGPILDGKCFSAGGSGNIQSFCEVGLKISGLSPIVSEPMVVYPNVSLTSVSVATPGSHLIAALGTSDGYLKKILLSNAEPAEYEELLIDEGNAILPDTTLSPKQDYFYVLSTSRITKIRVQTCSKYTNCSSCLQSNDPYCGWCSLEKRCTIKSACQKASEKSPRWLSLGTGQQCIDFEQVLPDRIPINQMTSVKLVIRTLPELPAGAKYKCIFGSAEPIDAQVLPIGLSCQTPKINARPAIVGVADHILVPLSVRSSETNKDFVSRNFAYYDCSKHATCSSCVTCQWACHWCVYENKCTHDVSTCQKAIVSGENSAVQQNQGVMFCPRFHVTDERGYGTNESSNVVLLANNVSHEIKFEVENLPRPQPGHTGFQCIVKIEDANMLVPARVLQNKYIVCDRTTYSYNAHVGEYHASVRVVWNRNHHIDTALITLYKCEILGSHRDHADCSLCVTRHARYHCTWCASSCTYVSTCPQVAHTECPRPRIDIIKPLSGPVEGGTLVTIEGSNLGLKERDVKDKIRVGDVPCKLVSYEVSVRIVCVTGPSPNRKEITVPVVVGNEAGFTESTVLFSYQDIKLFSVLPSFGPQSGGTQLAISGKYLNIGNHITAYLDGMICAVNVTQASSSRLTCHTSKAPTAMMVKKLTLKIDGANRTLIGNPYNYTVDPTIVEIKPLKSFVSGGRMITVHGTNFNTIQKPIMEVYMDNNLDRAINRSVCIVLNANQMECPSPSIRAALDDTTRRKRSLPPRVTPKLVDNKLTLQIGFVMDGVRTVRDLQKHFPLLRSLLTYVHDPKYFHFPGSIRSYKGDTLVIEGEHLNSASDETDVTVLIGTSSCNVTSLAMSQLVCTPPEQQPANDDAFESPEDIDLPLVTVFVGRALKFEIGYLRYDLATYSNYSFPSEAVAGVAVGTITLIILFAIVLFVYCRKSTQAEREYKRIQIQMDTLESNVRSECKQAFAELQTDMSDLTADLENSGIPTLDHMNYVMKVFFPGVIDHPILNAPKVRMKGPRSNYDAAMLQFEQLINTKCFTLTFIETLEAQKSFNIRDKVNVASLLMVVLMGKMEYATDILKSLLLRLIEKSVYTKHPQLMLRRTESVVEKMLTNWMALCMYKYLKEFAGSSLFLLFKAIKHQIEKGLVDAVTHDARYSLSEERLLKEQIETNVVTVHVVLDDLDEKIQCKVLDCDTISQAKSKILDAVFKNMPFSMRPSIHEVDLEWRHGRGGHLILQDDDLTTKTVNGWKRLNTLAHYGVKDVAVMSLISRQNNAFALKCILPCHNCAGMFINNTQSPIIASNGHIEADANHRVYHLVKPLEDHTYQSCKLSERTHKAIPEIFLTRLLSTKGTIQKFVDDFFTTILTVNESLPPAVKWLFDLLDEAARKHGIADQEVVHAWKSNSLPLRFWVNFIKNPDFIFDVNKTVTVDACLSVIAQTFMDACSTTEHRLGKDSPSNKLLFAKDIPNYRTMVEEFYVSVAALPQIADQEISTAMQELSVQQAEEFDTISALKELYIYVVKYRDQLLESLDNDLHCRKNHLTHKLINVARILEGDALDPNLALQLC